MYRKIKGISRLLMGNEDGFFWTIVLAVGAAVLVVGGAIYGAVQAGGAMGDYSRSSHQAEEAVSGADTAQSQTTLDQVQKTHGQGGLPVMTPVLEAGIRAQGGGGPKYLGISYTIGRWITSAIDWATSKNPEPSDTQQQTNPTVTGEDLDKNTQVKDVTDEGAAAGTGSGGGGSGCNDGCNP